jgi:hypothetical protein
MIKKRVEFNFDELDDKLRKLKKGFLYQQLLKTLPHFEQDQRKKFEGDICIERISSFITNYFEIEINGGNFLFSNFGCS